MWQAGRATKHAQTQFTAAWAAIFLVAVLFLTVILAGFGKDAVPSGTGCGRGYRDLLADNERLKTRLLATEKTLHVANTRLRSAEENATALSNSLREEAVRRQHLEAKLRDLRVHDSDAASGGHDDKSGATADADRRAIERLRSQLREADRNASKAEEQNRELRSELRRAQEDARKVDEQRLRTTERPETTSSPLPHTATDDLRSGDGITVSPMQRFFRSLGLPRLTASMLLVTGLMAVFGPSGYVRVFLVTTGNAVGALLASSSAGFLTDQWWLQGFSAIDSAAAMLDGDGTLLEYGFCLFVFVMGLVRWKTGVECSLFEVVDDVDPRDRRAQLLQRPLLT